jgi:hypothetical protein
VQVCAKNCTTRGMEHDSHDPRMVRLPPDQQAYVTDILHRCGTPHAARILRLSKSTVARIVATGACLPGTAALVREALSRRGQQ